MIDGINLEAPNERRLFVEVSYNLAKSMWDYLSDKKQNKNQHFWDMGMSTFEHGCAICEEIGLFSYEPKGYRLNFDFFDAKEYLSNANPNFSYNFEDFIERLLWATSHYYLDTISNERHAFSVSDDIKPLMWAFVDCGYAVSEDMEFKWTDKIGPIMKKAGFWYEDGTSIRTHEIEHWKKFKEEMWSNMSWLQKQYLARWIIGKQRLDLARYLSARWNGEKFCWMPNNFKSKNLDSTEWFSLSHYFGDKLLEIRRKPPF